MDNRSYTCNCPPLMQDGRFISSYIRGRTVDQLIRKITNLDSAQDYKLYLQQNTNKILSNLNVSLRENNVCNNIPCDQTDLKKLIIKPKFVSLPNAPQPTSTYRPIDEEIDIPFADYNN